jgi:hypothetical protein
MQETLKTGGNFDAIMGADFFYHRDHRRSSRLYGYSRGGFRDRENSFRRIFDHFHHFTDRRAAKTDGMKPLVKQTGLRRRRRPANPTEPIQKPDRRSPLKALAHA